MKAIFKNFVAVVILCGSDVVMAGNTFNISLQGSLPTQVVTGRTAIALYTVSNNLPTSVSNITINSLPENTAQSTSTDNQIYSPDLCNSTTILSAYGQAGNSCTLKIAISGGTNGGAFNVCGNPSTGGVICLPNISSPLKKVTQISADQTNVNIESATASPISAPTDGSIVPIILNNTTANTIANNVTISQLPVGVSLINRSSDCDNLFPGEDCVIEISADNSFTQSGAPNIYGSNTNLINDIVIEPTGPLPAIAVGWTMDSALILSDNMTNGIDWSQVYKDNLISSLSGVSCNSSFCMAIEAQHFMRSDQSRITWTSPVTFSSAVSIGAVSCASSYCVVGGNNVDNSKAEIMYSHDEGATWTQVAFTNDEDNFIRAVYCQGEHCLAGEDNSILSSSDSGATWTAVFNNSGGSVSGITCSGTICVAIGSSSFSNTLIYYSIDSGNTWTISNNYPDANVNLNGVSCTSSYCIAVGTKFSPGSTMGQVLKSTDGGANWSNVLSIPSADLTAVACKNSQCFLSGSLAGHPTIYYSITSGASWTAANLSNGLAMTSGSIDGLSF